MAEEMKVGCARPTGGPVGDAPPPASDDSPTPTPPKEVSPMIMVGRKAPDFTAPAYHKGKFVSVKLSEYLGQWVLLCFYRGTSPSSERPKFRQLPKKSGSMRSWGSRCSP